MSLFQKLKLKLPTSDDMHYKVAYKQPASPADFWIPLTITYNSEQEAIKAALALCLNNKTKCAVYPSDLTVSLEEAERTNPPRVLFVTPEDLGL